MSFAILTNSVGLVKQYPVEAPRAAGLVLVTATVGHITFAVRSQYLNIQNKATTASNLGVYIHYGQGTYVALTCDAAVGDDYIAPGEQLSMPAGVDWVSFLSPNGTLTVNGPADANLVCYALN